MELFPSNPAIDMAGYRIAYTWAAVPDGVHQIDVDIAGTADQPSIRMQLTLYGVQASAPLSVSAPLPGGQMYTHKRVYPAEGWVRVGQHRYEFDPTRDLAVLDEHRTFLPYRTRWLWGTFAGMSDTGIVGANFALRPTVPGSEEESALWVDGLCEPLADIAFTASDPADPGEPWTMRSADGRLDVTFVPEDRKVVKHQLVLASIDYWQLVGTYSGTVGGRRVNRIRGVCESMTARL